MGILRSILGLDDRLKSPQQSVTTADMPTIDAKESISEILHPFLTFMDGMAENLSTERMEQLTLRDAITRFVEGKPEQWQPTKGALIVRPHREGKLVLWAYLDKENGIVRKEDGKPFGRKAICGRLDDELTATLAGREMLIVE